MKRVVVTGLGCYTAIGADCDTFKRALFRGESGIGPITRYDAQYTAVKVAAEVKDYDPAAHFSKSELAQVDRYAQFALLATREAIADASLEFSGALAERTAVVHGTGIGGQETQEANYYRMYAEGAPRLHPFVVPKLIPSASSSQISMEFGVTGPCFSTTSACSSAGHAICMSLMMMRAGLVDVAITGGAEACITRGTIKAWEGLRVMAKDTCRPFSKGRGGLVIGEGAGTLVLETLDHALARGAHIYGELAGIGMRSDAHNIIQPLVEGASRAMQLALADAGLDPGDIDYINAHGTGTAQNDPNESRAIRAVFEQHADRLAVSSTKAMHGHTLGAAAALEGIATVMAMNEQMAPPTMNFLEPDPECDLDYVPNEARAMPIRAALSNSFAFGGLNTSLVFRPYTA